MKVKPTASKPAPPGGIEAWLGDPRAEQYFGRSFALRFGVLAAIVSGSESRAEVARRHGASRQAAAKHAARARRIFDMTTPG